MAVRILFGTGSSDDGNAVEGDLGDYATLYMFACKKC